MKMENFNMSRFGKLLRWTYWHDKNEFVRSQLQGLIGLVFCFIFLHMGSDQGNRDFLRTGSLVIMICLFINFVCTASNMHYTMKTRDDWRALNLLPASNLEKFLARYLSALLMGVGVIVELLFADIIQYLISLIVMPSSAQLVISHAISDPTLFESQPLGEALASIVVMIMLHSCFLLGANLFRSAKYAWLLTSVTLIIVAAIIVSIVYHTGSFQKESIVPDWIEYTLCCVIIVFNYWLSFRLFCRRQLIGKFINH